MAEENKNVETVEASEPKAVEKKAKKEEKKPNFFVRAGRKIKKFTTDTFHEMKKVRWTPKGELKKSTILVVVTCLVTAALLACVDTVFSFLINTIAGLIG